MSKAIFETKSNRFIDNVSNIILRAFRTSCQLYVSAEKCQKNRDCNLISICNYTVI